MSPLSRIVVTGMGAVTCHGIRAETLIEGLCAGRSGIQLWRPFAEAALTVRVAAPAKNLADIPVSGDFNGPPVFSMALAAAKEALESARLPLAQVEAAGLTAAIGWQWPSIETCARTESEEEAYGTIQTQTDFGLKEFASALGIQGPQTACYSACAASLQSVENACLLLRSGLCQVCLTGGADSRLQLLAAMGYLRLGVLAEGFENSPQSASRPFDAARSGFVVGEGAGFLVLETLEHALKRNREPLAELLATASTCDAWRPTDPEPGGESAAACMRLCLERAEIEPGAVDYINAHGTSTRLNDAAEIRAMERVFGLRTGGIPVSAFKSMIGHLAMASGAVELIGVIGAIREGIIPPTLNLEMPDPEGAGTDFVPLKPRRAEVCIAMKNAFGFGGQNTSVLIGKWLRKNEW